MLIEFPTINQTDLIPLFEQNKYLFIVSKTVLREGNGRILVDDIKNPQVALMSYKVFEIVTGDVKSIHAKKILENVRENRLVIFPNKEWAEFAKEQINLTPYQRIKFSSSKLDIEHLNKLLEKELPEGFTLHKVDVEIVYNMNIKLAPAFLPWFDSPEAFVHRGLAYCIKKDEEEKVVCVVAAAMPIYDDEFEIQVLTDDDPKYRRKGFATIACAALLKESLERGLTPHWDADNEISSKLALKLGFTDPEHYNAFICTENKPRKNGK
ncbi:MAG: GNAT family N-acetyltransferase [Candidatus Heimdallarchaeota archaeon]